MLLPEMRFLILCVLLGYAAAVDWFGRDQSSAVPTKELSRKSANKRVIAKKTQNYSFPLQPCQRKFSILIPDSYVSHGKTPKRVYDAGTIQLAGSFPGESRDCIN
ncbi:unnamed protein product [Strongylus vulgaris]|uniref:Uncharacterized protein n=1 Tax=Strongylus vulgaris TaxID=40348 RepID=A0A3P7JJM6_STRVU|nr:unnamed protein product [Strongylus vulgaris]